MSRIYILIFFVVAFLNGVPVFSYSTEEERSNASHVTTDEVYISLEKEDLRKNRHLLPFLSIDFFENGKVYVYCTDETLNRIAEAGIAFTIENPPGRVDYELNMRSSEQLFEKDLTLSWDFYPTYEAYESLMYQFEANFPDLIQIVNMGTLPSGRSILFAKISSDIRNSNPEPRFMYTSTMHGDEVTGFVLLLRLIHYLLHNYGQDDEITFLLDNMEIWICPNENPDGTYTNDNSTVNGATRTNANNVDLNRNYPNPRSNPTQTLQFETQTMIRLTDSLNFVMSANIHGGFEVVNYPFDSWLSAQRTHADHVWWQKVSQEYADTARFYSPSDYMNPTGRSFSDGITHGGDWYVIYGSRQDYMNYYAHQRELTLELSKTKILPPEKLPDHWDYNYRSLINYMKNAKYGIRGIVTDYFTQEPIIAQIQIKDHDHSNSWVYSSLPYGDFYRPIAPGTYDIEVSADGYEPVVLNEVRVSERSFVFHDIKMLKEGLTIPSNLEVDRISEARILAHTGVKVYPNPASRYVFVESNSPLIGINLVDVSGRVVVKHNPGTKNIALNVESLSSGIYFMVVYSGKGIDTHLLHIHHAGR